MKTNYLLPLSLLLLAGCSPGDKKSQLDKLKKQQADLQVKIESLEKEISASDTTAVSSKAKNVLLTAISLQPFRHFIKIQAKVDGDENIGVSPKAPGTISKINVSTGEEVKKGQVLAEQDNQVILQGIEEVQNARTFANTLFQKQKNLWEQKIGTEIQYLSAKNNLESLDKKLATLNEQLEMTKIKSPISGVVDEIDVKAGQAVMPGMTAVRVVNYSKLKVKGELAESYIAKVKKGDRVKIEFPDLHKETETTLTHVSGAINTLNRTFNVEITLEGGGYYPNMISILKIMDYENNAAVVVPVNMIQYSAAGNFVYVAAERNGKNYAQKRAVAAGNACDGLTEITKGLAAGDRLITTGYQNLNEGDEIKF